jgi:hypothetical protein
MEKDAIRLALLRPTVPPASSSSSSSSSRGLASRSADVYFQQPSVIHLLLQEATLQERLAQALLERVSEVEASQTDVSGEKMSALNNKQHRGTKVPMSDVLSHLPLIPLLFCYPLCSPSAELKSLLTSLKRLDRVHHPDQLVSTLEEVMRLTNDEEVRREVITAMPEIIGDAVPKVKRAGGDGKQKSEWAGLGLPWLLLRGRLRVFAPLVCSLPDSSM